MAGNPYHDKDGKFTSKGNEGAGVDNKPEPKKSSNDPWQELVGSLMDNLNRLYPNKGSKKPEPKPSHDTEGKFTEPSNNDIEKNNAIYEAKRDWAMKNGWRPDPSNPKMDANHFIIEKTLNHLIELENEHLPEEYKLDRSDINQEWDGDLAYQLSLDGVPEGAIDELLDIFRSEAPDYDTWAENSRKNSKWFNQIEDVLEDDDNSKNSDFGAKETGYGPVVPNEIDKNDLDQTGALTNEEVDNLFDKPLSEKDFYKEANDKIKENNRKMQLMTSQVPYNGLDPKSKEAYDKLKAENDELNNSIDNYDMDRKFAGKLSDMGFGPDSSKEGSRGVSDLDNRINELYDQLASLETKNGVNGEYNSRDRATEQQIRNEISTLSKERKERLLYETYNDFRNKAFDDLKSLGQVTIEDASAFNEGEDGEYLIFDDNPVGKQVSGQDLTNKIAEIIKDYPSLDYRIVPVNGWYNGDEKINAYKLKLKPKYNN